MKVKVVVKFKDKHTGKIHNPGDVLTVSKDRLAEILKVAPLVEELVENTDDKTTEPKPAAKKTGKKKTVNAE